MSTSTNQSNEDVQKVIAHLQCSDSDFHYTAEKVAKLVKEARAEAFEQAGWSCLALSEGSDLASRCARRMVELAAEERAK